MGFWTVCFIFLPQMMRFMLRSAFTGTKLHQVDKEHWSRKPLLFLMFHVIHSVLPCHPSISGLGSKTNITAASSTRYSDQLGTSAHFNMSEAMQQSQEEAIRDVHSTGMGFSRKQSPPETKLGYFETHSHEPMPTNNVPGACDTSHL